MTGAVDADLDVAIEATAAGDDVAFARIVAAHHEDMRRVLLGTALLGIGLFAPESETGANRPNFP